MHSVYSNISNTYYDEIGRANKIARLYVFIYQETSN